MEFSLTLYVHSLSPLTYRETVVGRQGGKGVKDSKDEEGADRLEKIEISESWKSQ